MRRYETIFIVRSNIGEDEVTDITNRISSIISADQGSIIKLDKWGSKKLAYLINKESHGYYIYMDYAGEPAMVTEIERISKIDDRVLKYMTVKLADSCDPTAIIAELAKAAETAAAAETTTSTEDDDKSPDKVEETKIPAKGDDKSPDEADKKEE